MRHTSTLCLFLSLAAACFGDRLDNTYLPPASAKTAGGSGAFLGTPSFSPQKISFGGNQGSFGGHAARQQQYQGNFAPAASQTYSQGHHSGGAQAYSQGASFRNPNNDVPILRYSNDNHGDGTYSFSYETGNSIKAEEHGRALGDGTSAQGGFSYVSPEGHTYSLTYTADENGFHPVGDHLPTPPPIPEAILKAIELNQREAAKNGGAYDDGSYKGEYSHGGSVSVSAARNNYQNHQNQNHQGYHY